MKEILFQLDANLPASLQAQLREQVVTGILNRALQPGERLPSSRRLSQHLKVSRNTVMLAYQALADDGYLSPMPRSGYIVSKDAPVHPHPFDDGDNDATESSINWASRLVGERWPLQQVEKPLNWREYKFPFVYGQADSRLFGHSEWRDCARQALGARDFGSLAGDFGVNDDPLLVDYITSHSMPQRGIHTRPQNVLVTLGAQNALYLVLALLADAKTVIGMEEPGYPDMRNIARQRGSTIVPLAVDDEGLVLDEAALSRCDIVFVTPSHQCPTTVTMPISKRRKLLELADRHDFLIIEDDYDYEMNFLATPSPALKTLDRSGRVIYVGSFSKSLFPGLRLGYLAADPEFVREARTLRHLMFRHPPGHSQRTAAYFMALGHYSAQIRKLNRTFLERRTIMAEALASVGLGNNNAATFGGASFWIEGPPALDADELHRRLKPKSVLIESGKPFFHKPEENRRFFRVAYSSIPRDKIREGVELIAQAIEEIAKEELAPSTRSSGASLMDEHIYQ